MCKVESNFEKASINTSEVEGVPSRLKLSTLCPKFQRRHRVSLGLFRYRDCDLLTTIKYFVSLRFNSKLKVKRNWPVQICSWLLADT